MNRSHDMGRLPMPMLLSKSCPYDLQVDTEQRLAWAPRKAEGTTTGYSEDAVSSDAYSKRRSAWVFKPREHAICLLMMLTGSV